MGLAEKLRYISIPPEKSGTYQVLQETTAAAARSYDWVGALGADAPKGKCWLRIEALTTADYVRFGPTSTTATTTANGWHIGVGEDEWWYVDPVNHRYIDHISTGAGTIKIMVASPIGERRDI